jgi:Protein of unknown function (DUF1570)
MIQRIRFLEKNLRQSCSKQISRRTWLASAFLGVTGLSAASPPAWSMQADGADGSEADEIASVQADAKKAGLEPFSHRRTDHFLGLGDADARFRNVALEICESLQSDFLRYFSQKGFKVALPKKRLTVITLMGTASYKAYTGEEPGPLDGGHYDLDTNRLVMFDFRPNGEGPDVVANPERVNRLALVHETTHLLCFNTGLLSRKANVPLWVSEGLATHVELWQNKRSRIGEPNRLWITFLNDARKNLNDARKNGTAWVPIADLVASDKSFDDKKTAELSQAESWLMVHYLLKTPQQLPKFRAYLAGLQTDEAGANRVEYVEKHLGPLKNLDRELVRHLKRVSR